MDDTTATIIGWIARGLTALVFIPMGINHFRAAPARAMAAMIPPRMRREGALRPINLVYFTGVCEIAGGVGILIPDSVIPGVRIAASIALAVFLVFVFPANAYAAAHRERFGRVAIPLVPRLIAQLVLIAVVLVAGFIG